ncbi:MAG: Na(+)-translocating NADH-quinone reductase subunit A [Planctomycetota bacterium]
MFRIRKGLDLPFAGAPAESRIVSGPDVGHVALVGDDYVGMRPTMAVREGDTVKLGQVLFSDKKNAGVVHTSPGSGEVVAVRRGEKRKFLSVVVRLEGGDEETFDIVEGAVDAATVRAQLVASGLWTAFRTRPFSRVPAPDATPHSIFVTAIDTNPLAADPALVLKDVESDFKRGLGLVARLVDGPVHVCKAVGASIPTGGGEQVHEFAGPHPAGLPGTHIHLVDPVGEHRTVWHIGYQDVAAIGHLFRTGRLDPSRVVALGGPAHSNPRIVRTRLGASTDDLMAGEHNGRVRIISGSVLSGRAAAGAEAFLGRYHVQVTALSDEVERPFLGWLAPGFDRFSVTRAFMSRLLGKRVGPTNTAAQGDPRSIFPLGSYERVMPLDIEPTVLLKAIDVGDIERAIALGCLELDEEDLALCTVVCPGKNDFGIRLRALLTRIEREG